MRPTEKEIEAILKETFRYQLIKAGDAIRLFLWTFIGEPERAFDHAGFWLAKEMAQATCFTCPESAHPLDEMCPEAK